MNFKDNIVYKRKYLPIITSFLLLVMTLSVSYAFFIYNSYGTKDTTVDFGQLHMEIELNNPAEGIIINNQYPITDEEGINQATNYSFSVSGYNEMVDQTLSYQIIAKPGASQQDKILFDDNTIRIYLTDDQENVIYGPDYAYNFSDGGTIIATNSFSGGTSTNRIVHNYVLKVWISDDVVISNYSIEGKISYTQEDYENRYLSIKLQVRGSSSETP